MVVTITSLMKGNFRKSPSIVFLHGTYCINAKNYSMYAMVTQARYGIGRPAALGFLASEEAGSIDAFFGAFKRCHEEG